MHWNTAGKQGSCSSILNFPCLLCNLNCLSFLSAAPSVRAPNKTYGNMKGGALPSLSSRDRLPGLAMATSGLCYILHKSSSCFTDALPHLGAGLICQVELPGKFFPFSKPCCRLPSVHFLPPRFGAPVMPADAADSQGLGAGCKGKFQIVLPVLSLSQPSFLTSGHPHQNVASPSRMDAWRSADGEGYSYPLPRQEPQQNFDRQFKTSGELGHRVGDGMMAHRDLSASSLEDWKSFRLWTVSFKFHPSSKFCLFTLKCVLVLWPRYCSNRKHEFRASKHSLDLLIAYSKLYPKAPLLFHIYCWGHLCR